MAEITVNGEARAVDLPLTVAGLLAQFGIERRMVVVEQNGEIVPRPEFDVVEVAPGDSLEIVQMMAGG